MFRVWSFSCVCCLLLSVAFQGCSCDDDAGGMTTDGGMDGSLADSASDAAGDVVIPIGCGDGQLVSGEACDDGNTQSGDGCAADCSEVEANFVCLEAGEACLRIVTCGNGRVEGDETCDDRNVTSGDGCSDACVREEGWNCPVAGAACRATACGDGVRAGAEECDDGDTDDDDGCSATCVLEEGFKCEGTVCTETDCGDGIAEGTEDCDDGNLLIGDGCTPFCTREPECSNGTCVAVCGDEVVFSPEGCDDGNRRDGDGCSSDCQIEDGYACEEVAEEAPDSVVLPIVIRDFIAPLSCLDDENRDGGRLQQGEDGAQPPYGHPDFSCPNSGLVEGMVSTELVDGRPARSNNAPLITSNASFALWYQSDDDYNRTVVQAMTFEQTGSGTYDFESTNFFPLSDPLDDSSPAGFPTEPSSGEKYELLYQGGKNFYFTSEVRFWFQYDGSEVLSFFGDDDVWVYINGKLAVDIGGIHERAFGEVELADCASANPAMNDGDCISALDLTVGGIYEAAVFQAERNQTQSAYQLTLSNFNRAPSVCESDCGDGELASDEACDDGDDNGATYNGCSDVCTLTPYCGDGVVQDEHGEVCDDGLNLGAGPSACAPGCQSMGASCGDGVVQIDSGEQCDDGNTDNGDGCSDACNFEIR